MLLLRRVYTTGVAVIGTSMTSLILSLSSWLAERLYRSRLVAPSISADKSFPVDRPLAVVRPVYVAQYLPGKEERKHPEFLLLCF